MRIARIEAFQVQWSPEDPPSARSGFLRVWSDDGRCGLGEVSPMQGGLVSLTILKHHIAPAIAGADPLDHAVIHDRLLHRRVCTPSSRTRRGRWRASSVCPPRPASDSTSTKRRWRSAGCSCREPEHRLTALPDRRYSREESGLNFLFACIPSRIWDGRKKARERASPL
jgi:hypothetical protein